MGFAVPGNRVCVPELGRRNTVSTDIVPPIFLSRSYMLQAVDPNQAIQSFSRRCDNVCELSSWSFYFSLLPIYFPIHPGETTH